MEKPLKISLIWNAFRLSLAKEGGKNEDFKTSRIVVA
jgi:hypothetical protein